LPLRAEMLLVVPFENSSRAADFEWLGESFSEALNARIPGNGYQVITREDRLAALERLGLPPGAPLSRASLLRLGEEAGADWLVTGNYEVQGEELRARASLVHIRKPSLAPPLEQSGPLERLLDLQGELAWRLLRHLDSTFPLSRDAFLARSPRLSASAFESYVRGLLSLNRQQQRRYFLQANRLEPAYAAPIFRLGLIYFEDMDFATAARWLSRVPAEDALALDARFYLSLCHFHLSDYAQAAETLAPVAERLPAAPLWNNLGVFASRRGDPAAVAHFERALQTDPALMEPLFNLGLHYFRASQWQQALAPLERLVDLHPGDSAARALLVSTYDRLGQSDRAARLRQEAGGELPVLDPERDPLDLDRLTTQFSSRSQRPGVPAPGSGSARAGHVAVHIQRAEDLLAGNKLDDAQQELVEAILLDPGSHRAHLLLAEVYQRRGLHAEAIAELKASLWSQETVAARLRLAELYLSQGRAEDAREEIRAALALDPANDAARALQRRLPSAPGSEGRRP
ncbi:MAG: tetratricopeptide repeat protein, partial [Candidatus Acidiferrales bacterium]